MISEKKAKTPIGTVYPKKDLNIRTGAGVSYAIAEKTAQKNQPPRGTELSTPLGGFWF